MASAHDEGATHSDGGIRQPADFQPVPPPAVAPASDQDHRSGIALRLAFYGGVLVCLLEVTSSPLRPIAVAAALPLILSGLSLRLWAEKSLGALWSTRVRLLDDHILMQKGPYRFLRHPGYLGLALFYLGIAAAFGSLNGLLVFVLGLAPALAHRIALEEAALAERFGHQYERYATHTKRLVPFVF
jgi:protein-S-isoprenylcysteine O-methyltransferase Ste14